MEAHVLPRNTIELFPQISNKFTPKFPQPTPTLICGICTDAQRLGSISWASSGVTTEPWPNSNILALRIVETGHSIDGHQFVTQTSGAKTSQLQVLGGQLWDLFNISDLVQRLTWRLGLRKRSLISHWFREKENHQTSSFLKGIW